MKKSNAVILTICLLALTGCGEKSSPVGSFVDSYIESSIYESSDIESDEDYLAYKQIAENEYINDEGYYVSDEVDYTALEDSDAIHVTFAKNSYITINYYENAEMTSQLNPGGAYLHANDCIYADIIEIDNPNTDSYEFSGFEVWEFDGDGNRKKKLETEQFIDGLAYQIPMDFQGREISIIPIGEYVTREISLQDYEIDNNGENRELKGKWNVNGQATEALYASVSPVAPLTVTYEYKTDTYEFVSSDPKALYVNETDGCVSFEVIPASEGIQSFKVELRKAGTSEFDPSKHQIAHAKVEYKYEGKIIDETIQIANTKEIEYEITEIDEGYWIQKEGANKGKINLQSLDEDISNLVCKKEKVVVNFPQPDRGGKIIYYDGNRKITKNQEELYIGTTIRMEFEGNGWTCQYDDNTTYIVSESNPQTVNVDGQDVNNVFTEQENRPNVTIKLDDTVGIYSEFTVITSDHADEAPVKLEEKKTKELSYKNVETKNDLIIHVEQGALDEGEALKFQIKGKKKDKSEQTDIQYLKKIPGSLTIPLYDQNYNSVTVTVSRVPVMVFSNLSVNNGYITVRTADITENRGFKDGDVIEGSRKVEYTISAKDGFYVKNSGKEDNYKDTTKYSNYESSMESALEKHPVKKYCTVTLNDSDLYGTVSYKIDGKAVKAGKYELKEEQKLEMTYEITDGDHVISRESSNIFMQAWDKTKSKTKETVSIGITPELDGTTIIREMYISIENR